MTIPASGAFSFNTINLEVGYASGTSLSMSNARFRGLQDDYTNPISMSGARGKTWPPAWTTYSTANTTTMVSIPAGRTRMRVKMWGAGGAGGGGAEVNGGADLIPPCFASCKLRERTTES